MAMEHQTKLSITSNKVQKVQKSLEIDNLSRVFLCFSQAPAPHVTMWGSW